jgi:hypothetical protein
VKTTSRAVDVVNDVRDELINPLTAAGIALKTLLRRWDDLDDEGRLEIAATALLSVELLGDVAERITDLLIELTSIEGWAGEIRLPETEPPS